MRMMKGVFELRFQGERCRCPVAGVRDENRVEVAVATPFGLRRVHVLLGADRQLQEAHTFAFDYESGSVTRFELAIDGGPLPGSPSTYVGTVSGAGLEGSWRIVERERLADDDEDASHALGVGGQVPAEVEPAPEEPLVG